MLSHAQARDVLLRAYEVRGLPAPKLGERQIAQAIGFFEGRYGSAWNNANNWGAVQSYGNPPCPEGYREIDERTRDGKPRRSCLDVYPDPVTGAGAMLHQLYRRKGVPEAMRAGSAYKTAERMYQTKYYSGTKGTDEDRIAGYAQIIYDVSRSTARKLGERHAVTMHVMPVGAASKGGVGLLVIPLVLGGLYAWSKASAGRPNHGRP